MIDFILNKRSKKMTVHDLQSLCGFLNFLCRCIVPGRAFTRRLYAGYSNVKTKLKPHHHVRITGEIKSDLRVWKTFLSEPTAFCRPFMDFSKFWTADEIEFYTDSSGNFSLGMGGFCVDKWFCQEWDTHFLKKIRPSIDYLELYAVTVGVLLWIQNFKNRRIVIFCDNEGVVGILNTNSAKCRRSMILVRIIVLECLRWNVRIFAKHVKSRDNGIADALSRFQWSRFYKLTEKQKHGR